MSDFLPTFEKEVELTDKGLKFKKDLDFKRWEELGQCLNKAEKAVQWWIGDWLNYGEQKYGEMYAQALMQTDYDYGTLRDIKWVSGEIELSLRKDNVTFNHHKEVIKLPKDKREFYLNLSSTMSVRELRNHIRLNEKKEAKKIDFPKDKYNIIYADPPWEYEHMVSKSREIENQYPTMTLDEIKELPIQSICMEDSLLFMWATNPKLSESMEVIKSWGFDYRTNMVWVKDRIGMGYYFRQKHELLLVARKGEISPPEQSLRPDSVLVSPRGKHSEKPKEVYDLIESMYPEHKYIELFARNKRKSWKDWGYVKSS